jgi:voltage-gated potassium channel Kch
VVAVQAERVAMELLVSQVLVVLERTVILLGYLRQELVSVVILRAVVAVVAIQ